MINRVFLTTKTVEVSISAFVTVLINRVAFKGLQSSSLVCLALLAICLQLVILMNTAGQQLGPGEEKELRTPEQKKIDSQLLYAIYQMRGEAVAKGVPTEPIPLEKDAKGRVLIDIRAPVSKKLLARIEKLGGQVVSSYKDYDSILAYLSLGKLETLARSKEVKFIAPKPQATTN